MAAPLALGGQPANFTQAADKLVASVPGILLGILVNSATSGTMVIRDGITSAGTARTGTITTSTVGFIPMYMEMNVGCFISVGGTINATAVYAPYGLSRAVPTSPPQA